MGHISAGNNNDKKGNKSNQIKSFNWNDTSPIWLLVSWTVWILFSVCLRAFKSSLNCMYGQFFLSVTLRLHALLLKNNTWKLKISSSKLLWLIAYEFQGITMILLNIPFISLDLEWGEKFQKRLFHVFYQKKINFQ